MAWGFDGAQNSPKVLNNTVFAHGSICQTDDSRLWVRLNRISRMLQLLVAGLFDDSWSRNLEFASIASLTW